jgi:hypothetical protein
VNTFTWLAIAVTGPGAVFVFVWFLTSLHDLFRDEE